MTASIDFPFRALSLALTLAFTSAWPTRAQMVTGAAMEDFGKSFGLSVKGWSVQQTACSLGANALWPGEEATFTFFVKPGQPYRGPVKVDVIHYGTRGKPGDWWKPVVFKIADISSATVVTLYLLPARLAKLRPKLWQELKVGTRIVAHDFALDDWKPQETVELEGHRLFIWTVTEAQKRGEYEKQ